MLFSFFGRGKDVYAIVKKENNRRYDIDSFNTKILLHKGSVPMTFVRLYKFETSAQFAATVSTVVSSDAVTVVVGASSALWNFTLTILLTPCSCMVTP